MSAVEPLPPTIAWQGGVDGSLLLLDQTLLPHQRLVLELRELEAVCAAIRRLAVRGAPAIGVAAAYGMVLGVRALMAKGQAVVTAAEEVARVLEATRPTAVNLRWAVGEVVQVARAGGGLGELLATAQRLHEDDAERCRAMGEHGWQLVAEGNTVLTHCNTGRLATAGDGTALSVLFAAHRNGRRFSVFADETRPLLQGARLTALELAAEGIPVQVLPDSAAAGLISRGEVDVVLVGSDRVAANGDFANKVGTYPLALACKEHGVPFYVVAPLSTFDGKAESGAAIPIEERSAEEVLEFHGKAVSAPGVGARNPAFDVTPKDLVTGFVTEVGILRPPLDEAIKAALAACR